jgi:peptide-methionine (R)-S-oxide reductase
MFTRRTATLIGGFTMAGIGSIFGGGKSAPAQDFPVKKTDAEWRAQLSPESYYVLREHGTERAGTSPLDHEKRKGVFACAGCGKKLFQSDTKFNSGTGWPSFYQPMPGAVGESEDSSFFMRRTEVHCADCGGHLGHVFPDGPRPTGLRYCMNGVSLKFEPEA